MNKGFELIEVHHLFDIDVDRIEVLVHPQSVCHSMVEFIDGSILAQLGRTDMRLPIQNCLTHPERHDNSLPGIDWAELASLTFGAPDLERFPCLALAYEAIRAGGTLPAVLNAANEAGVSRFLSREIGFTDIARTIGDTMGRHTVIADPDPEEIEEADRWARRQVAGA